MYPDAFGIRPTIRDMATELAGHGYYVLVPNFFYREGPTPVIDLPGHIGEADRSALVAGLMPLIKGLTPRTRPAGRRRLPRLPHVPALRSAQGRSR